MRIECIFEIVEEALAAIKYVEEPSDAFTNCFDLWNDVEYLEEFFETHKSDLKGEFWQMSVEEAVMNVLTESENFKKDILFYAEQGKLGIEKHLEDFIFEPMHQNIYSHTRIESKSYGVTNKKSMLRLYAIRLGINEYVVTGGTIKLTKGLQERTHTAHELTKLNQVSSFLKRLGIDDASDFRFMEFKKKS